MRDLLSLVERQDICFIKKIFFPLQRKVDIFDVEIAGLLKFANPNIEICFYNDIDILEDSDEFNEFYLESIVIDNNETSSVENSFTTIAAVLQFIPPQYTSDYFNKGYQYPFGFFPGMMVPANKKILISTSSDEEYKKKRFGELEQLMDFVNKNKEELNGVEPSQYLVEFDDNAKKYVILDQYQNTYEFYETATMVYKVRLDTYTIMPDNFKETYDSSNEQQKVAMNIDKWVQMLNTRDYTNAYNVVDETFRNNNWGSEEAFEQYMRELLPLHYDVEYTTYSNENSTYVQTINLTDITGETDETINLNIIMQLKDNYEFVMSFSVQE